MKKEDLKIKDEFIPDWLPGINDSMQLDSGQQVCHLAVEYKGKTIEVSVCVYGDVKVFYKDGMYKCANSFPQELLDYFAGKRPDLAEEVNIIDNNWFELFFNDDPDNGIVVDVINFSDDTVNGIRDNLLDTIIDHLIRSVEKCPYCGSEIIEYVGDALPDDNETPFHCHECDRFFGIDGPDYKSMPTSDLFQAVCNGCSQETILVQAESYIEKDCIREFLLACLGVAIE